MLIDVESQKLLNMYSYCKDMNMQPYSGDYGDQPAFWIEAHRIITHNTNVASAKKQKDDEHKRKVEQQGVNPRESYNQ